ncbi:MAG: hypothetical protein IKK03_10720 [Lachnospiraceae bacterium]|nr:hypothetical protein [Lachnospiraceae bacterium]
MWNGISIFILIVEVILLISFIICRFKKKKLNETTTYLAVVFLVNLALNLVPYLYNVIVLKEKVNHVFGLFGCVMSAVQMFIGQGGGEAAIAFSEIVPIFAYAYILAVLISLIAVITAAIEAFRNTIVNSFRLTNAMKQTDCDVVMGNSPRALRYAKSYNTVLLLDDSVSKDTINELIEDEYVILHKGFTENLLKGYPFNTTTRYNLICINEEKSLDCVDTFIAYKKAAQKSKNIYLYVEMEGEKAETIRREIIEKNGMEAYINTFSMNELLVRTLIEEHPITKHIPNSYIEEATIKQGTEISVFTLGFGKFCSEWYRQSILNNQLITFDGEYKVLPINYFLCDTNIDTTEWNIGGLAEELGEYNTAEYFPLPELPYKTLTIDKSPASREVLKAIKAKVQKDNSYTLIIVDTNEDCHNIEIAAKLNSALFDRDNYQMFVRSEAAFTEDNANTTYFGKSESVLNHDVIVNDSLSVMAKKLNEVYTAQYAGAEERKRPDFTDYIQKKAEKDWADLDYFTMYSNIYSAMNLRVKLNLLGLDYIKNNNGNNALIEERYDHKGEYAYSEYFTPSVRNALIAQEHARWNAYHLLGEFLPLNKNGITIKSDDGKIVRFNVKNTVAKKHACLTTFNGLNDLSSYLAEKAGNGCTAADYDYYIYDEMLITSVKELLTSLGYSVIEK